MSHTLLQEVLQLFVMKLLSSFIFLETTNSKNGKFNLSKYELQIKIAKDFFLLCLLKAEQNNEKALRLFYYIAKSSS